MSELANYKSAVIRNLQANYKVNYNAIVRKYNALIATIQKSNLLKSIRMQRVNALVIQGNAELKSLFTKLQSDIAKVGQYVPPTQITINKKRKALLIGINYTGTSDALNGCLNDVDNVSNRLRTVYGFTDIQTLTDTTAIKPTREKIIESFTNLLASGEPGDLLYFHYSGHGGFSFDSSGDESDKQDEKIYPLDMNVILDDELKQIVMTKLKQDVTLFAFFDSCHSGSMLDLKYQWCDSLNYNNCTVHDKSSETIGRVFCFSGCTDEQQSADAKIGSVYQGAMTFAFLSCLQQQSNCTWKQLLVNMRNTLKMYNFKQIPQLSTGQLEDIDKQIIL
jgi:hypothetical protein